MKKSEFTGRTTSNQLLVQASERGIDLKFIDYSSRLQDKVPEYGAYIINLGSPTNNSHWTAMFLTPHTAFYFDSFGIVAPLQVEYFIKRCGYKNYYHSKVDLQQLNTSHCGQWTIEWLEWMNFHPDPTPKRYNEFIGQFFKNTKYNDSVLKKLYFEKPKF
jgi:hypothetical protein